MTMKTSKKKSEMDKPAKIPIRLSSSKKGLCDGDWLEVGLCLVKFGVKHTVCGIRVSFPSSVVVDGNNCEDLFQR